MEDRIGLRAIGVTLIFGFGFAWAMAHLPADTSRLNAEIDLFGKVVDQDSHGLPEVRVTYRYSFGTGNVRGRGMSQEDSRDGQATTDATGSFAITGLTGRVLAMESFTKEGYAAAVKTPAIFDFYGNPSPRITASAPASPIVFPMIDHKRTGEASPAAP